MFISIGDRPLILRDVQQIVFEKAQINLSSKALLNVKRNFDFLQAFARDKVIYGINTGFGPMAQYKIRSSDQKQLQYNLIRSHASGCGQALPDFAVRAAMLARVNSIMQARSGIHPDAPELLQELINLEIYPLIFQHGGVGASGDLVQLAHLALCMIGEGEVFVEGKLSETAQVFAEHQLAPLKMYLREGISLINGTSVMTGIGLVNLILAKNILNWSVFASALINEVVAAYDDHFSFELNAVKLHRGQQEIARIMRDMLGDSQMIRHRPDHLFEKHHNIEVFDDKVQEYYSLRCVPQILGPIYDTLARAERVVVDELNSVNDNPIVDHISHNVYHGGNFHGDYVSLEMDKIKIAITRLSMLAERQLNYLMNSKLNNKLPPFVNLGKLGLNFGMQGVQFTATSTVAENQMLSNSMYVHSIPNNNDNQDIVSMGTNSALIAHKVIENAYEVLGIELMALIQAVDYLEVQPRLGKFSSHIFHELRKIVPKFVGDSAKYPDVQAMKNYLWHTQLEEVREERGERREVRRERRDERS